jgi:hypothetical protein
MVSAVLSVLRGMQREFLLDLSDGRYFVVDFDLVEHSTRPSS